MTYLYNQSEPFEQFRKGITQGSYLLSLVKLTETIQEKKLFEVFLYTVETRNLEVPGIFKNTSKHPIIDSSESGLLHVIEI